ncbi:MAG: stage II sporulation protein P [Eubacterium sp.]|nr:stage II sporulation protein P [Eubacterium sp.]
MKKRLLKIIIITIVIISAFYILLEIAGAQQEQESKESVFSRWIQDMIVGTYLPSIRMINQDADNKITSDIYDGWLLAEYPVFLYSLATGESEDMAAESDYARLLMMEGSDEDRKSIADGELEYGEDAMHLEQGLADAMLAENGMYLENQMAGQEAGQQSENNVALEFTPMQEKSYRYKWDELQDYESLVKAFYAVDSTTRAGEELLQADELLSKDMRMQGSADDPQILIYHTHSQEAFSDSTPGDESTSIVGVGEHLTTILQEQYGYNVMHYTASFDKESRDYAYNNSLPALEKLLAEYPSIEVVIDLHRDAMPEARRLVLNLQGRPTAQFMFFNGLSRTSKGEIEYLENPYLQDNLAFSFQMQAACNEYYPGLARRVYLKAYRYNLHLCPKSLLIELGAQNNTVEEAMNACDPLAHVLDLVLSGKEPQRP